MTESVNSNSILYLPSLEFSNAANVSKEIYQKLLDHAAKDYEGFWAELANLHINWHEPFTKILNDCQSPFYKWFEDGLLNVSYNCLDRHLDKNAEKIAIIFEADNGNTTIITYQELYNKVCQFANGLKQIGIGRGDRVIIYMPHSIEAVVAMQAVVRIGAIHSVVFGGFSAKALGDRINDAQAICVITADISYRAGKVIKLKDNVDEALTILGNANLVKHIIVKKFDKLNPTKDKKIKLAEESQHKNRDIDIWWHDLIANQDTSCTPEIVDSEHPLFILYTSGSTGVPKGVQHASAGFLLGAIITMHWVLDIKPTDVFWCTADVGWITGHTYVAYGPLAVGATQVIYEGVPTYPDSSRYWQMIDKYKVSVFYTAPTAIRSLIKLGADLPGKYDLSSLRLLGSVGEPINPEAWKWYYTVVGNSKCPIVDTWWQTETGCHMLAPIPGVAALKPGSCVAPIPGIMIDIVDEDGNIVTDDKSGYLVITKPFPSQLRTIWGDPQRYQKAYYKDSIGNGKYYIAGDFISRDTDDYLWILGRTDDVLNVSGHRLSTMEIESALTQHSSVSEAAAVGIPHPIKGEAVIAFVVPKATKANLSFNQDYINELQAIVISSIGAIAKPDTIYVVEGLPKTRSGKIMRRLLRNIASRKAISGDISTLENPAILEQIKKLFPTYEK